MHVQKNICYVPYLLAPCVQLPRMFCRTVHIHDEYSICWDTLHDPKLIKVFNYNLLEKKLVFKFLKGKGEGRDFSIFKL